VLNGTPTQEASTLVGGTNPGRLLQGVLDVDTNTRNWRGTLLRGKVLVGVAKSSICKATA